MGRGYVGDAAVSLAIVRSTGRRASCSAAHNAAERTADIVEAVPAVLSNNAVVANSI